MKSKKKENKKINKKTIIILLIIFIVISMVVFFLFFNPFVKIELKGNKKETVVINTKYLEQGVKSTFFGKKLDVKISGKVNPKKPGQYYITYEVKIFFTTKKVKRVVIVKDKEKPVIELVGESIIDVCPNTEYQELGYKANDNYDGNITNKVKTKIKDNIVYYSVLDSSKNKTIIKRELKYQDVTLPVITLKGNTTQSIKVNGTYKELGYTASDNCDGDLTKNVKTSGSVNPKKTGNYTITYTVSDSVGNKGTTKRVVKVVSENTGGYPAINGYGETIEGPTYIKGILIVNKKYSIPSSFGGDNATAISALKELQNAASNAGYSMGLLSGYRSYATQKIIYERSVAKHDYAYADKNSARPGHSEHQTGLAFDVGDISSTFGDTARGKWLNDHCHEFGFIIRYPKGKTNITGYVYEPWHIRYVGKNVAQAIHNQNTTLEQYLGIA